MLGGQTSLDQNSGRFVTHQSWAILVWGQGGYPAERHSGVQWPLCPSTASPRHAATSSTPQYWFWRRSGGPLLTMTSTITVAGNFVAITMGTSEMSEHGHLLLFLLIFWPWEKFFLSDKKTSYLLQAPSACYATDWPWPNFSPWWLCSWTGNFWRHGSSCCGCAAAFSFAQLN